eukprot:10441005-Alexandrium_andersonii.AAC.1
MRGQTARPLYGAAPCVLRRNRRAQAGAAWAEPPTETLAAAITAHQAAMWRLATRALDAFGTRMPGLERPPAGARR